MPIEKQFGLRRWRFEDTDEGVATVWVSPGTVTFTDIAGMPFERATVVVDVDDKGHVFISRLELDASGPAGITRTALAAWGARLGRAAVASLSSSATADAPNGGALLIGSRTPMTEKETQDLLRPAPAPRKLADRDLRRVAEVYRQALEDGESTGKAVAAEFGIKPGTARKRIEVAGKRGYLDSAGSTRPADR